MKKIFICVIMILARGVVSYAQDTGYLWENFLKAEFDKVVETAEEMLRRIPENRIKPQLYYLLGTSYLEMAEANLARRSFRRLIDQYANSEWKETAELSLGDCFLIEQELEKAERSYLDFIQKYKKSSLLSLAYFKLAEVKRKSGSWEEARSLHEKVKDLFPHSLEASLSSDILSRNEFYFSLQVGAFINCENARELTDKLKAKGFPAYITEIVRLGQVFYRVRVGKFLSREETGQTKENLIQAGYTVRLYP